MDDLGPDPMRIEPRGLSRDSPPGLNGDPLVPTLSLGIVAASVTGLGIGHTHARRAAVRSGWRRRARRGSFVWALMQEPELFFTVLGQPRDDEDRPGAVGDALQAVMSALRIDKADLATPAEDSLAAATKPTS